MMKPSPKYLDNIAVYGFITQWVFCFMVTTANPTRVCQHDRDMHFYLLRVPKLGEICTSKHIYLSYGELILKTRFPITNFFLGNEAKVLLRIFYYIALGAFLKY